MTRASDHHLAPVEGWREWLRLRPFQRHSLVLTLGSIIYISYGVVIAAHPLTDDRRQSIQAILSLSGHSVIPWGVAWVVVGFLTLLSTRWPPASKLWGYAALSGMSACWALAYLTGVLFLHTGTINLSGFLVWGLLTIMWWGISGLSNPDDVPTHAAE